ncbi:UNVERIFIED_CONTAM: hypothetical protein GTU68_008904 [Idotea baltica]|nr:hypothetical protein [Idotea baltica]
MVISFSLQNSLILLEDIDAAFVSREDSRQVKTAYEGLSRLTFSGLLNCLDGVASTEARIVFMTTNYPERLDPALIRPGRVDVMEFIGYCTQSQLQAMFNRFYPDASLEMAELFSKSVDSSRFGISPAAVQGHFMMHKNSPQSAIDSSASLEKNCVDKTCAEARS